MKTETEFKVIIDQIGRVVVGDLVKEDKTTMSLSNPTIIHVQPNPDTGQLSVQVFPYIFVEFINPQERDSNVWHFQKSNIVQSDVILDDKILETYAKLKENSAKADDGIIDAEEVPQRYDAEEVKKPEVSTDGSESNVVDMFDK
jgi:hypothetical protein